MTSNRWQAFEREYLARVSERAALRLLGRFTCIVIALISVVLNLGELQRIAVFEAGLAVCFFWFAHDRVIRAQCSRLRQIVREIQRRTDSTPIDDEIIRLEDNLTTQYFRNPYQRWFAKTLSFEPIIIAVLVSAISTPFMFRPSIVQRDGSTYGNAAFSVKVGSEEEGNFFLNTSKEDQLCRVGVSLDGVTTYQRRERFGRRVDSVWFETEPRSPEVAHVDSLAVRQSQETGLVEISIRGKKEAKFLITVHVRFLQE